MTSRNFNNVTTRASLASPVAAGDTTLLVTGFSNNPAAPFTITVDRNTATEEIMLVTAVVTGALTVTRGYDGTAAQTHLAGAAVEHTAIALDFREANQHVNATSAVHGTTGSLVGTAGAQTIQDKTLVSPTAQADATLGDAIVASVPAAATGRNLFRGKGTAGTDVITVDQNGAVAAKSVTATDAPAGASALTRKDYVDTGLAGKAASVHTHVSADVTDAASAATVSVIVKRDGSGRAQVADPSAAADIATKNYVDATAGTAAATASALMRRDASGRVAVATPSAAGDAATKGYVDTADALKPAGAMAYADSASSFTTAAAAEQVGGLTLTATLDTGRAYAIVYEGVVGSGGAAGSVGVNVRAKAGATPTTASPIAGTQYSPTTSAAGGNGQMGISTGVRPFQVSAAGSWTFATTCRVRAGTATTAFLAVDDRAVHSLTLIDLGPAPAGTRSITSA